jgi:hypothetical protein
MMKYTIRIQFGGLIYDFHCKKALGVYLLFDLIIKGSTSYPGLRVWLLDEDGTVIKNN